MALENYRITEFQEKTQVDNGDYVLIDSATDGTHKYQLSRIPAQASAEVDAAVAAEKAQRQAADAELAGDIGTLSSGKVDKVAGKGLSTNDFTDALKTKLDGIEAGAEVNDVTSVAGKTGAVTLDGGDVSYSDETTYAEGTVGAAIGYVKSDLTKIFPDEAKAALLACFDHVMWTDADGETYLTALQEALANNPFEDATYGYGSFGYNWNAQSNVGCLQPNDSLLTRAKTPTPVRCTHGSFVAKSGYVVTIRCLKSTAYGEIQIPGAGTRTGYYDLVDVDPSSFGTTVLEGTEYVLVVCTKSDPTQQFTQTEIDNCYGTVFEYREVSA